MSRLAFIPDERADVAHASDGISRFGAYLRTHCCADRTASLPDALGFAAQAWSVATGPMMSPPYVLADPRIAATFLQWDDDGRMAVVVEFVEDVPVELARQVHSTCRTNPWEPEVPALERRLWLSVPMAAFGLPEPEHDSDGAPHVDAAKAAVRSMADRLNAAVADLLPRLERAEVV